MPRILIAEDDPEIALLERDYLEMNGFDVEVTGQGARVIPLLLEKDFNLLLLDIMLPGKNGYDICREIRSKINIPILMVTAKAEPPDKIRGLGLGADAYIAKPFDPGELVARVKAHINRFNRLTGEKTDDCLTVGNLKIMTQNWMVYRNGEPIKLPNREFTLLKFLAEHPNIVFSKETLFERIWGCDYIGDNATVTVHINRIREKIEDDPSSPRIIETVWGVGYRLNTV
jgi:DNA-binding response OmpR family regulator